LLASRRPSKLPCRTSTIPIRPDPERRWIPPRTRRTAVPTATPLPPAWLHAAHSGVLV